MNDWQFFRANPLRSYRLRLATPAEIDDLRAHGIFDRCCSLADGCFVHCLARIWREGEPRLERPMIVWPAGLELTEAECRSQWFKADRILAGKVEALPQ